MEKKFTLSLIAAMGRDKVIGFENGLPQWKLPRDMGRFVKITKEHKVVIVGRKTHESILKALGSKPLSGRTTIVLTRRLGYESAGCVIVSTPENALLEAERLGGRAIVIGGEEIYRLFFSRVDTIYFTHVDGKFEGDSFFPDYDEGEWEPVHKESFPPDSKNSHAHTFITLKKRGFVELSSARNTGQLKAMKDIAEKGWCPFCLENLQEHHKKPILRETPHWIITENQWPYENTRVHLLIIAKKHSESLSDLDPEAGIELLEIAQWAEKTFRIEGGGLILRFGDPRKSGATVRHLHAQIVTAMVSDRNDADYIPVRFRVG